MTSLNKELFYLDPTKTKIPNDGVSRVLRPETTDQWKVLEWELRHFVCDGEYKRGLERILDSFLINLSQAQQPAAWVSGFYGSGKSHLCRVLEYLWRDVTLPSGETARSLVDLPGDIAAHLRELSTAGKRQGGLWSAAGTLASGKAQQVRLAFLSVLFESAEIPPQYPLARFTIWAKNNGYFDDVESAVEAAGKTYEDEVRDLYVSPIIAKALLEADPTLGDSVKDVRGLLREQFPTRTEDITDEEMFDAMEDVLRLQSDSPDRYPLTLVVLDEMQQYLGEDNVRALAVQNIVEGVSARFDSSVLFLATGQSAMGATSTLQKLTDRFPVHVHLSDQDVETVVRQVVLRKKPSQTAALDSVLERVSGEIDKHLGGTRIAAVAADKKDLVADYPLLPTRRRFWELALRALDKAGKAGVLRTQLRIAHEATRAVAEESIGHVVGGDFLYDQQAAALQQSGVLLKEISEAILELKDDDSDGELKARICALVFLINEIPTQMTEDRETGLRATAPYIADLLVENLEEGGAQLRRRVPELLDELVDSGRLMQIDDTYRLQTEEGAALEKEYRQRRSAIGDDAAKLATLRYERLLRAVENALGGLRLIHGKSKTPRKASIHLGTEEPPGGDADIPIWVRDEWSVTASSVKKAAAEAGDDDPVVHVLLPKRDAERIKAALSSHAAAKETVQSKATPQTDEGKEALRAMKGRIASDEERLASLFEDVVAGASVFQGGGNELSATTLREAVETAAQHSLVRLFPKFDVADDAHWGKVVTNARDGAPDALEAVGHSGEAPGNPVCKELLGTISAAGTKGSSLDKTFSEPPYGWGQDAIRGGLLALFASRHIRAEQNGVSLPNPKQLEPRQIGKTTFFKEDEPPSMQQRLAVRGLLSSAEIAHENEQEHIQIPALLQKLLTVAAEAGGPAALPEPPDTSHIEDLQSLAGNQQFRAVADDHERLKADLTTWREAGQRREERQKEWETLEALLHHGRKLGVAAEISEQRDAIHDGRQLLDDPDPVRPLLEAITTPLREAVASAAEQLRSHHDAAIAELEKSDEWQQLEDPARGEIIAEVGLKRPDEIDISSQEKLLAVLNEAPLASWKDKIEVVRARAKRAREMAAKKLEPEAVRIPLASATLKTDADVNAYLAELRERLMKHIDQGHTVII